jgi:hypothetical protein
VSGNCASLIEEVCKAFWASNLETRVTTSCIGERGRKALRERLRQESVHESSVDVVSRLSSRCSVSLMQRR